MKIPVASSRPNINTNTNFGIKLNVNDDVHTFILKQNLTKALHSNKNIDKSSDKTVMLSTSYYVFLINFFKKIHPKSLEMYLDLSTEARSFIHSPMSFDRFTKQPQGKLYAPHESDKNLVYSIELESVEPDNKTTMNIFGAINTLIKKRGE